MGDALPVETEQDDGQHRTSQRDHRSRDARREAATEQDDGKAGGADREGSEIRVAQPAGRGDELVERGLALDLEAQHFRDLRPQDHQGKPVHEARDHRLGEKVGNEAQPQQSGQQADEPDHDAEPGREQRQPRRIAQRQRRHGDRDDGRHGGVRSNDEVTGAAEQGVGEHLAGTVGNHHAFKARSDVLVHHGTEMVEHVVHQARARSERTEQRLEADEPARRDDVVHADPPRAVVHHLLHTALA